MAGDKKVILIASAVLLMMIIGIYLQNKSTVFLAPPGGQCAGVCPSLGSETVTAEGDGEASYVVSESQAKSVIYSSITCRNAKSEAAEKCKEALQKAVDEAKKRCGAKKTQCEGTKSDSCSCVFPIYASPAAYCQLPATCTTKTSKYNGDVGSSFPDARKEKAEGDVKIVSTAHAGGSATLACPCEGRAKSTIVPVPVPEEEPFDTPFSTPEEEFGAEDLPKTA